MTKKNNIENPVLCKNYFKTWLNKWKTSFFRANYIRKNQIKEIYQGTCESDFGHESMSLFLEWQHKIANYLEFVMLWGSFARGAEDHFSFNRLKIDGVRQNMVTCGPSDIDALVVVNKCINRPVLLSNYFVLNKKLEVTEVIQKDLFRDVIILKFDKILEYFEEAQMKYIDLYLNSYFNNGILLKSNFKIDSIFNAQKNMRPNFKKNAEKYFTEKQKWMENYPRF